MTGTIPQIKFRKQKVAPEGGWGYLIGIGFTLPLACALGSLHSFGLMFNDFLASLGAGTSAVTLVTGVFFSAMSFAGLCASPLFKKFTLRSVGMFGAVIYFSGSLLMIFVTSVEMLIVAFGILQGFGIGFMVPVGYTTFNDYFIEKRVFMMSAAQAVKGLLIMLHPMIVNYSMNAYGFRGAMAVIAAINAHGIFRMLVQHPIEWHYKIVEVPEHELKPLVVKEINDNKIKVDVKTVQTIKEEPENESNSATIENGGRIYPARKMLKGRSKSLADATDLKNFGSLRTRISSIMSLSDLGGEVVVNHLKSTKIGTCAKIVEFLDLTLLKDIIYVNIIIGVSSGLFSDNIFSSLLPMYLKSLEFSINEAAKIVSIGTGADMISRFALAGLTLFLPLKARHIFLAGAVALFIVRFVFLYVISFKAMLGIMICIGFFRTWLHLPMALIFAEYLPSERFASGYGLFMFLQGNFVFVMGPITGWIRDVTQSYVAFVHSLQFFMAVCIVPWFIEIIWLRLRSKKDKN